MGRGSHACLDDTLKIFLPVFLVLTIFSIIFTDSHDTLVFHQLIHNDLGSFQPVLHGVMLASVSHLVALLDYVSRELVLIDDSMGEGLLFQVLLLSFENDTVDHLHNLMSLLLLDSEFELVLSGVSEHYVSDSQATDSMHAVATHKALPPAIIFSTFALQPASDSLLQHIDSSNLVQVSVDFRGHKAVPDFTELALVKVQSFNLALLHLLFL